MKYLFKINIGQGIHQGSDYLVESNKDIEAVREAYFAAKEAHPTLCPEAFMCQHGDESLPKAVYLEAKKLGFDCLPGLEASDDLDTVLANPDWHYDAMSDYVVWFLSVGDSELKLRMLEWDEAPTLDFPGEDEKGRRIGAIGLGLFS